MLQKNTVLSISFLEFINNITAVSNELLFSPEGGFITLKSKEAIVESDKYIEKFNFEAQKIAKNVNFSDTDKFIDEKRKDFIAFVQKHVDSQIPVWADEVFDSLVDNLLLELSVNKDKSSQIHESILFALDWISSVKKLNDTEKKALLDELNKEFIDVLNQDESKLIPSSSDIKSDSREFMRLWNMIIQDSEEFLNLDFASYLRKLSSSDINFFEAIRNKMKSLKKSSQKDEIFLINSAIEVLKIKDFKQQYDFIKQINEDFGSFSSENKYLSEEDKIKIIKRRIELFKDKNTSSKEYFKKLIVSSNE